MTGRELFAHRDSQNQSHEQDFLMLGGMGHASSVALGIALSRPHQRVFCLDGDGSALMHLGSLGTAGTTKNAQNLCHILLNNGVHDSVGGQPTIGNQIDFCKIAKACGYPKIHFVKHAKELENALVETSQYQQKTFIEIKIRPGNRPDLPRPNISPHDAKAAFQQFLQNEPTPD